jgi:tetratricopeptide (TPR) repeat protein
MKGNRGIVRIVPLVILTTILISGCKVEKVAVSGDGSVNLEESKKREYNYALTEATKQKLFGNFKQAAALYQKCIEVNPKSDAAYFQLSGIFMIGGNLEMARTMNLKATELDPDNYWYKIQLAQLYMMTEETDSAVSIYEDILARWPDKLEIQYELSRIYSETGKDAKALKILNEIEKENGISEPVTMLKEQIYIKEKKYDRAIQEINAIIEAAPEEIRYLGILAELYTTLDRKEEARETYKKIFEIEPENGIAQLSMAEFYRMNGEQEKQFEYLDMAFRNKYLPIERKMSVIAEMLTDEAIFKENKKEIDSLIQILSLDYPDDYRIKTARADYLSKIENYVDAARLYEDILKEQKGNYFIWEQAIFIENILGNNEEVYKKCSEALNYFPDKPFLYLFLGNSAMQKEENNEAIRSLEKGLKYVKNNIPLTVQFYAFLAEAWRNIGQYGKSDEYFEKALQMEPENIMILNNYGYYLALREEKLDKAEKMSKKTILQEPENPTYLDTYAWILFKSGKTAEAKIYMLKAIENGGDQDPDILEHYGDILQKLGDVDEAVKFWKKAKENGGSSEELERKINE